MANEIITLGVSEIHCRQGGIRKVHKFVIHKLVNLSFILPFPIRNAI